MNKLRIGDKIYCHTTGYMAKGPLFAQEGKYYNVVGVLSGNIEIDTEYVSRHCWTIKNVDAAFFNYFLIRPFIKYSVKKHKFMKNENWG